MFIEFDRYITIFSTMATNKKKSSRFQFNIFLNSSFTWEALPSIARTMAFNIAQLMSCPKSFVNFVTLESQVELRFEQLFLGGP